MAIQKTAAQPSPIVETQYGKVRGAVERGVHIYRGLPYGGPTEGAGRFMPPSAPAAWVGIRDATAIGPRCIQMAGGIFLRPSVGDYFGGGRPVRAALAEQPDSENCLVLNVLTPGTEGQRPVLVYIHGGGFAMGSSLLTLFSDGLVREQDVVLVGVNHRLNVFGYVYLGGLSDQYAVGNAGQLDLIAALQWVRDNIAQFGGDPGNVTIFGESGGGAKISTLMATPAAQGLFRRAIVESGSLLRVGSIDEATQGASALLAQLGLTPRQVDRLQEVPAAQLFAAAAEVFGPASAAMRVGPIVDGHNLLQQTWESRAPEISAHVPMIIGNCKDESTLFSQENEALFSLDEAGLRERLVAAALPEGEVDGLLAVYHRNHPQESPSDLYFRISTDRGARWNATRQAELKAEQGGANVYLYYFRWDTPCGAMRLVLYPESERLSQQISSAWAAFARSGDPSPSGLAWPPYTLSRRGTMVFDIPEGQVVDDPDGEERRLLRHRPSGNLL
jgi:para-nitrobenzyl esterase